MPKDSYTFLGRTDSIGYFWQGLVSSCKYVFISSYQEIILWHYSLRYPSFPYLKTCFYSCSEIKVNVCPLQSICLLTKHNHAMFHTRSYKSSKPFSIIHSDSNKPLR